MTPLTGLLAASPPNLSNDINWHDSGGEYDAEAKIFNATFGGVADIEAAFNHARREEEKQLSLAPNQLGNLDLPSQSVWDNMTDDAKALYIVNAERVARTGMKPGVIGLPFAGVEAHIDAISQHYGDILHDNDQTGHYHDGTPTYRIERDPVIGTQHLANISYPPDPSRGDPSQEAPYETWQPVHSDGSNHYFADTFNGVGSCHEFITRSENLAYYASTAPILLPLERSIYSFIYDDASSHWGHREALFLQDNALIYSDRTPGETGYNNNFGSNQTEGFMGVYVRSSNKVDNPNNLYQPFQSFGDFSYGTVVVMDFFDPVADGTPGCSYNVTTTTESLPNAVKTGVLNAAADDAVTTRNTPITLPILQNDSVTDQLANVSIITKPTHGTATISKDNKITYLPAASFTGSDSLVYQLTSKSGRTTSAVVSLTIKEPPKPARATNEPARPARASASNANNGSLPVADDQTSTTTSPADNSSGGGSLGGLFLFLTLLPARLLRRRRF